MYRQARFNTWGKFKRPLEGKTLAKSCHCLSDHFHRSGLEGRTCDELRLRKIAKDIKDYRVEVTIPLELDGVKLGTYRCDFVVEENDGSTTYVEAKGIPFPTWRKNWAILQGMRRGDPMFHFVVVTK